MDEKISLFLLICIAKYAISLPLSPSLQISFLSLKGLEKDEQELLKNVANGKQAEDHAESPQGTFNRILEANKDTQMETYGGDMLLKAGRSATTCTECLWPKSTDGTVRIPYTISASYSTDVLNLISTSMQEYESLTCVQFVPRKNENDYLNIISGNGCVSYIGKIGGGQMLSLAGGCFYRGIFQHELNHALGFFHEQNRSDRDDHITINYQFISQKNWANFDKINTNNLGLEYDFSSVMHYGAYDFSNTSSKPSIVTKPPNMPIGQIDGLSILDVSKINRLYQCNLCANLLNQQNGTMTSANYPSVYPNNANCVWLIRTPSGQVSLRFNGFDLQSSPNCANDYIKVYDGPSKSSPLMLGQTCGSGLLPPLIASTNQMLVEFVSDSSIAGVGFTATYSAIQCGGSYFGVIKNFTSPGYPVAYAPSMHCTYTITAPVGKRISLTVSDFHLEDSVYCMYDYMTIQADSRQKGPYCGDNNVPGFTTTGNSLVMTFHSDSSNQSKGFQASYTFIPGA
ncbi:embryonic protein UVS.2-like [Gastrophryne carolinensis]